MTIRVTVEDTERPDDTETQELSDGPDGWVLVCGEGCRMAHVQTYPTKGTYIVTIKAVTDE